MPAIGFDYHWQDYRGQARSYERHKRKAQMEKPHGKNLRTGRHSQTGQAYLITSNTLERKKIFKEVWIGRILVAEMRRATDAGLVDSLAWVIMPDHLHWLFVLQDSSVETVMCQIKSCSAIAINRQTGTSQKIWQSGYHDHAVRHEEDMRKIARYIVANPLRAGLVKHIGDYPLWDAIWL